MTESQAIAAAKRRARKIQNWVAVVYEPGEGFATATDWELETYFAGCRAIAYFGPDGEPA